MPAAQKGPEGLSFGSRPSSPPASPEPLASCICPQWLLLAFLSSLHSLILLCQKVQTLFTTVRAGGSMAGSFVIGTMFPKILVQSGSLNSRKLVLQKSCADSCHVLGPEIFGCHSQSIMHLSLPTRAVHVRTL